MTLSIDDINRLQQENAELKAENERLNRCMMEALHHEGEKIRETIKYKSCLQEIKTLAEFEKIKDGTLIPIDEISTLYNDRNFRLMKIQEVIKKAEEK